MHGRRTTLAAVLLLVAGVVGGLLATATPASADAVLLWHLDQRPAGLPAVAEPARTLSTADADLSVGPEGSALHADVALAGVPTPETAADLRLRIGTVDTSGACLVDWELVVPTLDPTGPASRTGTSIRVSVAMPQPESVDTRCASVTLVAPDGSVLDELSDDASRLVIADPGAEARIKQVMGRYVRPDHWSTVWVLVGHRGADADGVRVTATGAGVRVRGYTAELTLRQGDQVWAPVQVRLRGDRARELRISARPFGNLAFVFPGTRTILLRPAG